MNSKKASLLIVAITTINIALVVIDVASSDDVTRNVGGASTQRPHAQMKVLRRRPLDGVCNKTNEVVKCWSGCEDTCSTPCPIVSTSSVSNVNGTGCRKKCVCANGFLRAKNGDCVKTEQCGGTSAQPKLISMKLATTNVCPFDLNLTIAKPPTLNGKNCSYDFRNGSGDCLPPRIVCPGLNCSQPHEAVQYCGGCFNTCHRNCPVGQITCPDPICGCAEGFTRLSEVSGAPCVPIGQCGVNSIAQ